jgi:hypothetical protein
MENTLLAFSLMSEANEPLKLDMRNLVQRWIIIVPTYHVGNTVCKSIVTKMVTMRNFEVIYSKPKLHRICNKLLTNIK